MSQQSTPSDDVKADLDISLDTNRPNHSTRRAMIVMTALLGLGAATAFGYFAYHLYCWVTTGGWHAPTYLTLPMIIGHLLRGMGLSFVCWRLTKLICSIDRETSEFHVDFRWRLSSFWKAAAWTTSLLAAFWIFEQIHFARHDPRMIVMPPYFESGYGSIKPNRLEVRRASEEPIAGWEKTKYRGSDKFYYVAPAPDLTGDDIEKALVRVSYLFGHQDAVVDILMTPAGAKKMEKLTTDHYSKPIAFFYDGELRSTPRVFSAITGRAQLTGLLSMEEAATIIRHGGEQ